MKALIVCAGRPPSLKLIEKHILDCDMKIAADGGLNSFVMADVAPDIIVGDMDSLDVSDLERFEGIGGLCIKADAEKDDTDTMLAAETALDRGANEIVLLGATGGRIDHLLSNIMLLKWSLSVGVKLMIEDDIQSIEIGQGKFDIFGEKGQMISLLPADERAKVSASGLYYPLDGLVLANSRPRGVSNVLLGERAKIETDAPLLVIKNKL